MSTHDATSSVVGRVGGFNADVAPAFVAGRGGVTVDASRTAKGRCLLVRVVDDSGNGVRLKLSRRQARLLAYLLERGWDAWERAVAADSGSGPRPSDGVSTPSTPRVPRERPSDIVRHEPGRPRGRTSP